MPSRKLDLEMTPELIERALEQATMEQLGRALAQKRLETPDWKDGRPRTKAPVALVER